MAILKEILKTLKKVVLALLIIMGIFYIVAAFCVGIFDKQSVKNLSAEQVETVINSYELELPKGAEVMSFDRYIYMRDRYYVLEIKGVNDISEFKKINEHVNIYKEIKFSFLKVLFPNLKYIPSRVSQKDITCYYKNNKLYISIFPYNKERGMEVMDTFNLLKAE